MAIIRPSLTQVGTAVEVQFIVFSGVLQPFGHTMRDITRPGVDGQAWRKEGRRAMASSFRAMRDSTNAAVEALKQQVADLKSAIHTFKDEFGTDVGRVIVVDTKLIEDRRLGAATGGLANPSQRLLTWEILLQRTEVPVEA